jgi:hypothetical protein
MPVTQPPPPADRPASGPSRTLLPYGEVFLACAMLLIVVLTS